MVLCVVIHQHKRLQPFVWKSLGFLNLFLAISEQKGVLAGSVKRYFRYHFPRLEFLSSQSQQLWTEWFLRSSQSLSITLSRVVVLFNCMKRNGSLDCVVVINKTSYACDQAWVCQSTKCLLCFLQDSETEAPVFLPHQLILPKSRIDS